MWGSLVVGLLGSRSKLSVVPAVRGEQGRPSLALLPLVMLRGFYLLGKKRTRVAPTPLNLNTNWDRESMGDVLAKGFIGSMAPYCPSIMSQTTLGLAKLLISLSC